MEGEKKRLRLLDTCAICLEASDSAALILPCNHVYCLSCIGEWLERSKLCPLCKTKVKTLIFDVESEREYKEINLEEESTLFCGTKEHARRRRIYYENLQPLVRNSTHPFANKPKTAAYFNEIQSRFEPFLQRELEAVLRLEEVNALQMFFSGLFRTKGLVDKEFIRENIYPYFHDKSEKFIDEVEAYASSHLNLASYDASVYYVPKEMLKGDKNVDEIVREIAQRERMRRKGIQKLMKEQKANSKRSAVPNAEEEEEEEKEDMACEGASLASEERQRKRKREEDEYEIGFKDGYEEGFEDGVRRRKKLKSSSKASRNRKESEDSNESESSERAEEESEDGRDFEEEDTEEERKSPRRRHKSRHHHKHHKRQRKDSSEGHRHSHRSKHKRKHKHRERHKSAEDLQHE